MAPGASFVCRVEKTKMAGQAGVDGDAGRLQVANFADHDDVRRLPQDRAKRGRKGHPDARY